MTHPVDDPRGLSGIGQQVGLAAHDQRPGVALAAAPGRQAVLDQPRGGLVQLPASDFQLAAHLGPGLAERCGRAGGH